MIKASAICTIREKICYGFAVRHSLGSITNFPLTIGVKFDNLESLIIYLVSIAKTNGFLITYNHAFEAIWYDIIFIDLDKPSEFSRYPVSFDSMC